MEIREITNITMEEGIYVPTFKYTKITDEFTRRYHGCLERMILLNYMEIYLLEWLAEQPTGDGIVRTDVIERRKFINFILGISNLGGADKQIIYKDSSVKSALATLKRLRFLIPFPNNIRGVCWVNPAYFYRCGTEQKRMELIRKIKIETKNEI